MLGRGIHIPSNRAGVVVAIAAAMLISSFLSGPAAGQGIAQVSLNGIPGVLSSPQVAELAVGFEQGRFPLTVVITTPDRQPVEFRLRFLLEREGETVLDVESDPIAFERGVYVYTSFDQEPAITFPVSYGELASAATGSLGQDVSRTGLLSEGAYTLTIEAIAVDDARLVLSVPSVSTFFVQYLEPPVILSPQPEEVVRGTLPIFSWLPVIGGPAAATFDYEFLLVEIYPGQEPQQAIEANRPIELVDLPARTTFPYTPDRLPLEPGRRYAWQVTVRDAEDRIPFTDGGKSEIGTFRVGRVDAAMAEWVYPYSRPIVTFNLSDAELRPTGYFVHGSLEGQTGEAPVGAFFDNVTIDPVTLGITEGSVEILGPLAENAGAIESVALRHILSDDTPPTRPSLVIRQSSTAEQARLSVVVGPSSDPETGVSDVSIRVASLMQQSDSGDLDASFFSWKSIHGNTDLDAAAFGGGSHVLRVPESLFDALALGWLEVQVRVTNGLGLQTVVSETVGSPADVSPPLLAIRDFRYLGYYHSEHPNSVVLGTVNVSDDESGIVRLQYRIVGDTLRGWTTIAAPGTNRFNAVEILVPLPAATSDSTVSVEIGAVNRGGLTASWIGEAAIDIDETPPVQVADLGAFIESDVDPRVELSSTALWDPESGIRQLSYRIVDDARPTTVYVEWTPFPASKLAEVKRTQLNFANRRNVRIDVRAVNSAGLSAEFSQTITVPALAIADLSAPSTPELSVRLVRNPRGAGDVSLQLSIGGSVDRESGISRVLYRVEDASTGAALLAWQSAEGIRGGAYNGSVENVAVTVPEDASALRVVVRVTNGAGLSASATRTVVIAIQDTSPPEVREIQAYGQGDRLLIFVDGLADPQSFIERVEYRILAPDGSVLIDWSNYPVVPSRRPSYGRQLLRAPIPQGSGPEIVVQLRVINGAGLSTITEERIQLSQ